MDADKLRLLIDRRRGTMSMRDVSQMVAINPTSLYEFMNGTRDTMSVESCLLLAQWLDMAAPGVLRMVGHGRIADLFASVNGPESDPLVDQFRAIVAGLAASDVAAVLDTARRHADVLRQSSGINHGESISTAAAGARANAGERRRRNT